MVFAVACHEPDRIGLCATRISVARAGRALVENVSFQVSPGELCALIGPNGGGKSTILRALSGIWPTCAGAVRLDGTPVASMRRADLARRIAFVPQETGMDFDFTVEEVVEMGRYLLRGRFARPSSEDRRAVAEAMEQCDVAHLRHRSVTTLSGGERQRALIARSLSLRPDYLLLDEPTASLDIEHALDVMGLCAALAASGCAVVLATHDLTSAARFAHSILVVQAGRIAASGASGDVLNAEVIGAVFGVEAERLQSSDGKPVLAFQRKKVIQ